jgi:hypothetical protein
MPACPSCGKDNRCAADEANCWCGSVKAQGGVGDGMICLCRECLTKESVSVFDEDGALSREFLLSRGECCGNKCRNCPYGWRAVP